MHAIARKLVLIYSALRTLIFGFFSIFSVFNKNPVLKIISNIIIIFLISWVLGFFIYLNNIDKNWNEIQSNHSDLEVKTDAIIVLTGGSERIRNALHLMKKDYASKLFISGVNKKVKLPELFVIHGVEKKDFFKLLTKIELGFSASNTIENAIEVKEWLGKNSNVKTIRLITSNYHIDRAKNEIKNLSPDIKIITHPVLPVNVNNTDLPSSVYVGIGFSKPLIIDICQFELESATLSKIVFSIYFIRYFL